MISRRRTAHPAQQHTIWLKSQNVSSLNPTAITDDIKARDSYEENERQYYNILIQPNC
jgi:hypothetical protein